MTENDVLGFDPQDLFKEEEKTENQSAGNPNIYHMRPAESVSKDGIYRATIKVVYNPFDRKKSWLNQQSYGLEDSKGFFTVVSSLTVDDKNCPIFKAWKKCRFAKQQDGTFKTKEDEVLWRQQAKKEEGGLALFDKRQGRYCLVQILEDKNHPELEGAFKLWKIPASIYDVIKQKQDPTDTNKAAIPVMDYLFGRAIEIEVAPGPDDKSKPERKTREIKYSGELTEEVVSCINPDKSPLLTSDEQDILDEYVSEMKKVWKSRVPEERAEMLAEINKSENTNKFREIYVRVLEQIKTWAPNLDTLSYHEWPADVVKRVNDWIDIVLSGRTPKAELFEGTTTTSTANVEQSQESTAETSSADPFAAGSDNDDLPF